MNNMNQFVKAVTLEATRLWLLILLSETIVPQTSLCFNASSGRLNMQLFHCHMVRCNMTLNVEILLQCQSVSGSGDSKGGLGGPWPPSFFLTFPFKFVWLTYTGFPNAFCKNTGHFVNGARPELCRNS